MNATLEEFDDKFLLTLEGKFDTSAEFDVEKIVQPLYSLHRKDVVIDCTNLKYIASCGLRIVLHIIKVAREGDGKVWVQSPNSYIQDVFKLTGFCNLLEII